jgi:hypothetical protein
VRGLHTIDHALHKLGVPAVLCGAIIQIDDEGRERGAALAARLPLLDEAIAGPSLVTLTLGVSW